ncbi:MAG: S41 family peptidase [Prevotella sp.]|nr:S41 family peptidase [Prevotella sp.]
MKKHLPLFLFLLLGLAACIDVDEYDTSARGNFEALWHIMDEHYCFFEEKQAAYGVDWNEVHDRYSKQINGNMSQSQLFEVMANMLSELRDGHVNLYSTFDMARNWSWQENYAKNFSDSLERRYLGTDYRIAGSLKYRRLDDNTGYIRCSTFSSGFGNGNLDQIMMYLAPCNALIIDVRNNGGGLLTEAEKLAERFTNEKRLVGYMKHKTGKGHSDFSDFEEQHISPADGVRWQKQVYILTNRSVFSAANEFVKYMRQMDNVVVVGDKTGGGGGMPLTNELPNGWGVRFSACPMFDVDKNSTEGGIEPDIRVSLSEEDRLAGIDTIIETVRKIIGSRQ